MANITLIKAYARSDGLLKLVAAAGDYDRDPSGHDHVVAANPESEEGGPVVGEQYDVKFHLQGGVREVTGMTFEGYNRLGDARFDRA